MQSTPTPVRRTEPRATPVYCPNAKVARYADDFGKSLDGKHLTACQHRFIREFFKGANLYLGGRAGTGKSFVTRELFTYLQKCRVSVGKTALTGVAAFNIGGQTIHSWAGLGLADEHVEAIIAKVRKNRNARARIEAVEVLFIDEISMAKGDLLNKLDVVLKYVRHNNSPWGGVQMVFCGDFLQLPPIFKGDDAAEFAFDCRAWKESSLQPVVLEEVVRQQANSELLKVLNDVRVGNTGSLANLSMRIGATWSDSEIEPVRVFCRNVDVDDYNAERLSKLTTEERVFQAQDDGRDVDTEFFNKNCMAPERLVLKIGAQVMCLSNIDVEAGVVNGSIGVVKAYAGDGVRVKFTTCTVVLSRVKWERKEQVVGADGKITYRVVATRSQIPLKVAYASTVHKVQGMTLDRAVIDVGEAFDTSMVYVALSRVRDLESLSLVGTIPNSAVRVNRRCVEFYQSITDSY